MRTNIIILALLSVIFGVLAVVYTLWHMFTVGQSEDGVTQNWLTISGVEWAGTTALSLTSVLALFLSTWLALHDRTLGGLMPEDRPDADVDDGDPEIGHFSPWSWWPLVLSAGVALCFLGLAIGIWLFAIGAAVSLIGLVGWVYEYQRGNFAH